MQQVFAPCYTVTRGTGRGTFYYMLPVLFYYGSCSLYMNIVDEHDEELVKLAGMANFLRVRVMVERNLIIDTVGG